MFTASVAQLVGVVLQGTPSTGPARGWAQPIATVLAALATASIAYGVMRLQKRRDSEEWYKNFRSVHADFWSGDALLVRARQMIVNEEDYDALRAVLLDRLKTVECRVSRDRYQDLEALDRFLAVLVRMKDINAGAARMDNRQKMLWKTAHYSYWMKLIEDPGRTELATYVRRHWPDLLLPTESKIVSRGPRAL